MICLGLTYYPLLKGHSLGQIQVFLGMFAVLSVYLHLVGRRALSGACMGLCCLVKPQYGILMLWALLRRNWRFLAGSTAVFVPMTLWSAAIYGIGDYASYWKVLKDLARHGETFWANQSLNGFLNRLLMNGSPVEWSFTQLAPFHPAVYAASVAFAALVLLAALAGRSGNREAPVRVLDMLCAFSAATIASPIAWEHHYGSFLAVFAFALPATLRYRPSGKAFLLALLMCFVLVSTVILRPELVFRDRWVGMVGSHLFIGATLLYLLLLRLRLDGSGKGIWN
jgi:hypothetical protein